ncbi:hypothetical protein [Acidicapsa acidisoli]|uniref:hypothetical protein n=1 Tax=Acidicapsa acidisoli TaxID=1615681 RepID=UPI0021DFD2C4|nr:hypothetical protein [Acidicapsa acidisoli]
MNPICSTEVSHCEVARWNWNFAWNWKCALMSATARSVVYAAAVAHSRNRDGFAIVVVEMAYVTLTSGVYAGLQQAALGLRRRWLGDLGIVVGVPGLAQLLDWLLHRTVGAPAPHRALVSVCVFTLISALFHRHVMRHGTFLTGKQGRSMADDFRRIPRLLLSFVLEPVVLFRTMPVRLAQVSRTENSQDIELAA